jgi:hypothetical protein
MNSMFNMFRSFNMFGSNLKKKLINLFLTSDNTITISSDNYIEGVK